MDGAIRLVECQGAEVAGIVAVCIEETPLTNRYRQRYKCVSAVMPGGDIQRQCNGQSLESFKAYRPEMAFPALRRAAR